MWQKNKSPVEKLSLWPSGKQVAEVADFPVPIKEFHLFTQKWLPSV